MKKLLALFLLASISSCASHRYFAVCRDLLVQRNDLLLFNSSEKKLLCGDPKDATWNEIPRPQQIYHLKTFLLEHGYYAPQIHEDPQRVIVELGPRVTIHTFEVAGWPGEVAKFHERRYRYLPMEPKSLDSVEAAALEQLKGNGYPCAEVNLVALPEQKLVKLSVKPGSKRPFGVSHLEVSPDIDSRTLRRFEAFTPEEDYDYHLLEISEKRIRDSGLVQDAIYLPHCENGEEKFYVSQKAFSGKSRFVSLGAGFDTEQLAIVQAQLSFNRLSAKGSSLQSTAFASFREQSLKNQLKFHLWPPESRSYLYSNVDIQHLNERAFDTLTLSTRGGVGLSVETKHSRLDFETGPHAEYLKVYRGVGLAENRNIAAEFTGVLTSHLYEYFLSTPQSGQKLSFHTEVTLKELGATFAALRTGLQGESLWKIYDNHLLDLIFGLRGSYSATYSLDGKADEIPANYRYFLGGSANMRGFGRDTLPGSEVGALTMGYLGAEFRLARFLHAVEPIIFGDLGSLGRHTYSFDRPLYASPGFGFRALLPFGTLRGTMAHGYTFNAASKDTVGGYQFFVSFGEEF